jgi:hypothetical protein
MAGKAWNDVPPAPRPAPPPSSKGGWQSNPGGNAKGAPAPPQYSPPVIPNQSGNYSRPSAPPTAGPGPIGGIGVPPPINQYLGGDTTYLNQQRAFQKALADFLAQETQQKSKINEDYGSATKALGGQKEFDLNNMMQDFASRGLINSGLYAGAVGDYNKGFLQQMNELTKNQRRSLADLLAGETNFKKEQSLAAQRAREEAIARRASQYGL